MKLFTVDALIAGTDVIVGSAARSVTTNDAPPDIRASASVRDSPSGAVVTTYATGSRVYAVARTKSSDWVQVRDLASPDRTVRIDAADVDLDQNISEPPVADCSRFGDTITALGDTTTTSVPDRTTTSVPDTTTSSTTTQPPTTVTPETTTTDAPDTSLPTIGQASVSPSRSSIDDVQSHRSRGNCPGVEWATATRETCPQSGPCN